MSDVPVLRQRTPCADKNDALGWTTGAWYQMLGVSVGLRSNSEPGLASLTRRLPSEFEAAEPTEVDLLFSLKVGGEAQRRGVRHFHILYDGWTAIGRSHDADEPLDVFSQVLPVRLSMAAAGVVLAGARVMALEDRQVLLLGEAAGHAAEALERAGGTRIAQGLVRLDELEPAMLLVVEPGKGRWRPRSLTSGQAALAMLERAPAFRLRPGPVMQAVSRMAERSTAFRGRCAEPDQVARFVRRRLSVS